VQGERLDEIAARYYGDPSLWRLIADFNGVADPGHLAPGSILRIPPLSGGRTR
jgi:nucleoid-associated protein YgaU